MTAAFNVNARHPFSLLPYQEAGRWIDAFRGREGRWPDAGDLADALQSGRLRGDFSLRTYAQALADMKALEADF